MLLGCYRKGDCEDPQVYAAALVRVFTNYPAQSVMAVTDPVSGLPGRIKFLPTVAEVTDALEAVTPRQKFAGRAAADYSPDRWHKLPAPQPDTQEQRERVFSWWHQETRPMFSDEPVKGGNAYTPPPEVEARAKARLSELAREPLPMLSPAALKLCGIDPAREHQEAAE